MTKTTSKSIAVVSVLGAAAIALGAVSSWFTNWDVKTWCNHWGQGAPIAVEPNDPDVVPATKNGAIVSNGVSNGVSVLSAVIPANAYAANAIASSADTAYRLTATVEPDTATYADCVWSVAFADANSAWAQGKTVANYVTVTPDSANSNIANVVCLQPFGAQIVVTVRAARYADVSATCMVDYVKRVNNVSINMETSAVSFGGTYTVNLTADYSAGTIDGLLRVGTSGFGMTLTSALKSAWTLPSIATFDDCAKFGSVSYSTPLEFTMCAHPVDAFVIYDSSNSMFSKPAIHASWREARQTDFVHAVTAVQGDHAVMTIPYEYVTDNGVADTSGMLTANLRFDATNLTIAVTNITLSQDSIKF